MVMYMSKKTFLIIIVVLVIAISVVLCHKILFNTDDIAPAETNLPLEKQEIINDKPIQTGVISEISIDSIKGITQEEAEKLCYNVMGEKDEETGFIFSFGTTGAVEKDGKQYYVIRASWLVDNSHMSYIGDFFVSSDGKEIYDGFVQQGNYTMDKIIWSK